MNYNTATSAPRENAAVPRKISPPSTLGKKRNGRGNRRPSQPQQQPGVWEVNKRQKFNSNSSGSNRSMSSSSRSKDGGKDLVAEPMDLEPIFPKLNQSDAAHARRIQQRRKTVAMGKNTVGYAEYTKQVPKHKRRSRSMNTPGTPDHTLDIPTKRWQGMIKAWRKALHQYDPPDLVNTSMTASEDSKSTPKSDTSNNDNNIQSRQIEHAIAKGLLVDVSTPTPAGRKTASRTSPNKDDGDSPFSVLSEASPAGRKSNNILEELAVADMRWGDMCDSDSDDDLL